MALLLKPEKKPEVISFAAAAMNTILKKITMVLQNVKVQVFWRILIKSAGLHGNLNFVYFANT